MELRQVEQALQQVEHDLAEHYREIAALRVERARLRRKKLRLLISCSEAPVAESSETVAPASWACIQTGLARSCRLL